MADSKLIPQPDNNLAPAKGNSLLRLRGKWAMIINGSGIVASIPAAFRWGGDIIDWLQRADFLSAPAIQVLKWLLSPAAGTILFMLFVALFVAALIRTVNASQRATQGAGTRQSGEQPLLEGSSGAEVKQLQGRVEELERENVALERHRDDAIKHHEQVRRENDALQMSLTEKINDLESRKWLHEIADQDRRFIDQRVKVIGCEIVRHDLIKELYVEFKFTILNASVYGVVVDGDSMTGDIYFNARLLSKRNKMIENTAKYCGHAETKDFTVRQWLDKDEINDILEAPENADDVFQLGSLHIPLKGYPDEAGVYQKDLKIYGLRLPTKPLRELNQRSLACE